ncbi:hypothetical protein [Streptomyces sp. NPDC058045]|uniref:hypothetical protein n=1 Tax=Streptomyces sp. NPDC058045 TaxID=3346311 RepID=UPI0036E08E45
MTTARKTTTVFLTVLCGLLLTITGLTQRWPLWAWPVTAVLLLALPMAAARVAARRRGSIPVDFEEQLTATPVERTDCHVNRVVLPSLWDDYSFVFSATVRWCLLERPGGGPVLNPAGLAVDTVLARARAVTEQREPGRASLVRHELSGALSRMYADPTGSLQAMADNISLALPEPDQQRLDRLADVRKDKAVWEHQRKYEQSRRQYLGEDVLKDTGSAVVWWLARNEEQVEQTVSDLPLLAQLTSAANDTDIPERLQNLMAQHLGEAADLNTEEPAPGHTATDHLAGLFDAMGFREGDVRRPMLARQFAELLTEQDRHETAEALRFHFDPPETAPPGDDEKPADGNNDGF